MDDFSSAKKSSFPKTTFKVVSVLTPAPVVEIAKSITLPTAGGTPGSASDFIDLVKSTFIHHTTSDGENVKTQEQGEHGKRLQHHSSMARYNQFIELLQNQRKRTIDARSFFEQILELFAGHDDLVLGFNAFLPEGTAIVSTVDANGDRKFVWREEGAKDLVQKGTENEVQEQNQEIVEIGDSEDEEYGEECGRLKYSEELAKVESNDEEINNVEGGQKENEEDKE